MLWFTPSLSLLLLLILLHLQLDSVSVEVLEARLQGLATTNTKLLIQLEDSIFVTNICLLKEKGMFV